MEINTSSLHSEITDRGWSTVENITSQSEFFALAASLGSPIQIEGGQYLKELRPLDQSQAKPGTFSARHGRGAFPFHTDTAFWITPARLVLLRATGGDFRRPTLLQSFEKIIPKESSFLFDRAVWIIDRGTSPRYSKMPFNNAAGQGLRFDPECMTAVNQSAESAMTLISSSNASPITVTWKQNMVLILNNWRLLHARGEAPQNEGQRVLERIYTT